MLRIKWDYNPNESIGVNIRNPQKSRSMFNSQRACNGPCTPTRNPCQVACGERDIHQGGVFGDGESGGWGYEEEKNEKGIKLYTDMSNEASYPVEKKFTVNWQMRKGLTGMVNEKKAIENSRR